MPKPGGRKIWLMANSGPNPILPDFVTFNQVDDSGNPKAVSTGRILLRIIIVALVLGLSAFLLAVGVTHVKDCPGQEEIPAYLIGVGALHVISASLQLVALLTILCWKGGLLSNISIVLEISLVRWCFGFLTMFAVVFFVFGSIYVFGAYDRGEVCNSTVFTIAFAWLLATYVVLGLVFVIVCCCCIFMSQE